MANVLNTDKQINIIALTEGSSIRSIERMMGVYRDTIMRHVTVLCVPPAVSPLMAVRAALVAEMRANANPA